MRLALTYLLALILAASQALGDDLPLEAPESADQCAQFVMNYADGFQMSERAMDLILGDIEKFHDHARWLAVKTLAGRHLKNGKPAALRRPRLQGARQALENMECAADAQNCLDSLVSTHLESVYFGPFTKMKAQLEGTAPTAGFVFVFAPPKREQERLAFLLDQPQFKDLPRLIVSHEERPIQTVLQNQASLIRYGKGASGRLPGVSPQGALLDVHLFGMISADILGEEMNRFVETRAVYSDLHKIRFHLYPEFHYVEGDSPTHQLARRLRNAGGIQLLAAELAAEMTLQEENLAIRSSPRPVITGRHSSYLEIEIVIENPR